MTILGVAIVGIHTKIIHPCSHLLLHRTKFFLFLIFSNLVFQLLLYGPEFGNSNHEYGWTTSRL